MESDIIDTVSSMMIFCGWLINSVGNLGDSEDPINIFLMTLGIILIGMGVVVII